MRFCLVHPIRQLLHQDPFTCRAFTKPQGYIGDPGLLDFIYSVEDGRGPPAGTTPLGRLLFSVTTNSHVCQAVRARRRIVADAIEQLAAGDARPSILSVASSHLREADLCNALPQHRIGRWVALDSDTDSLQEVDQCYGQHGIETLAGTVRQLLGGHLELGTFDLIYSVALYDYLQHAIAKRLIERLFTMLRPGGRLLVANLSPEVSERGYMESYMNWHLIYRTHAEMLDLAANLDPEEIEDIRLLTEATDKMMFLRILRK